jgi:hypothetical protein
MDQVGWVNLYFPWTEPGEQAALEKWLAANRL